MSELYQYEKCKWGLSWSSSTVSSLKMKVKEIKRYSPESGHLSNSTSFPPFHPWDCVVRNCSVICEPLSFVLNDFTYLVKGCLFTLLNSCYSPLPELINVAIAETNLLAGLAACSIILMLFSVCCMTIRVRILYSASALCCSARICHRSGGSNAFFTYNGL